MPNPAERYKDLTDLCEQYGATLVAVSKTRKEKEILALYQLGQKLFGENRVHELIIKANLLPSDIQWHLIGHLQTNKVRSAITYASCIQSLDSWKLWKRINDECTSAGTTVDCLLQIKVAEEDSKYGWNFEELLSILSGGEHHSLQHVRITGVMGMATLTDDTGRIRNEMKLLKNYFDLLKAKYFREDHFRILSMGMSGDYIFALEEGSNMIRIGSLLFE